MRLTRLNGMGLKYFLDTICGEPGRTKITASWKKKNNSIIVNAEIQDLSQRWYNYYVKGDKIQVAFSNLTDDEREFIMTGITKGEWDEIFKDEDDEEDTDGTNNPVSGV